jgi:hypothetical protein
MSSRCPGAPGVRPEPDVLHPGARGGGKESWRAKSAFGAHVPSSPPGGYSPSVSHSSGQAAVGPGRQGRRYNLSAMYPEPRPTVTPRIRHCIHSAAPAGRSPLVPWPKLIWSTATYLFCRRCSNGGQGSAHVAAGQSAGDCCRAHRLLFADRGSNLAVKQGKRGKCAGQGHRVEPPGGIEPPTFSLPWRFHLPLASKDLSGSTFHLQFSRLEGSVSASESMAVVTTDSPHLGLACHHGCPAQAR